MPRTDHRQVQDEDVDGENPSESCGDGLDDDEVAAQVRCQLSLTLAYTCRTLTEQLNTLKEKADRRKAWARSFEMQVNARHAGLTQRIEDGRMRLYVHPPKPMFLQIDRTSENKCITFKHSILPVLESAMRDFNLDLSPQSKVGLPLKLEIMRTTNMVVQASLLLESCQVLIACYDELTEATAPASSIPKSRQQFAEDREGLGRAFHAAKKMTYNQIHVRMADKVGEVQEPCSLDEKDEGLARKVLSTGRAVQGRDLSDGVGLGYLVRHFGKIVSDMQNLIEQ